MTPLQGQILCEIGRGINLSKSSIAKQLQKLYPDVNDAIKILLEKKIIEQNGEHQGRGKPEKFYILTKLGIQSLIDLKISLDDFWRMLFFVFDEKHNHKLQNFTIERLFSEYEKKVMLFSREFSPPIYDTAINLVESLKDSDQDRIYEVLVSSLPEKKQSKSEITEKDRNVYLNIQSDTDSNIMKIIDFHLLLHKGGFDLDMQCLSHFGLLFLLKHISSKTAVNQRMSADTKKDLNAIINSCHDLLPRIFENWEVLRKILSENELLENFNSVLNFKNNSMFTQSLQNDGLSEIYGILKSMRQVYALRIRQELESGLKIEEEWNLNNYKCDPHSNESLLIYYRRDPNDIGLPQTTLGVKGKVDMLDLESQIYDFDQYDQKYHFLLEQYYRQNNVKQSVEELLSFLFFVLFHHRVKNKLFYLKSDTSDQESKKESDEKILEIQEYWKKLNQKKELKEWYTKWVFEIMEFQKQNNVLLEKLTEFSIN